MCCKKSTCAFGEWDPGLGQCKHLVEGFIGQEVTVYRCGLHAEIEKTPGSEWNPAFGAGCCMSLFNSHRSRIVEVLLDPGHVDHPGASKLLMIGLAS